MLTKLLLEFPMSFSSQTQEKKSHKMTSLLLSILFLESIHHLTEDKSRQFCQNSNQQIACCSVCPRQSVSVTDKQSDGHSLNYCEKGRACNDPGPILDCSGCLVSFPQKHKDFFPPLLAFPVFCSRQKYWQWRQTQVVWNSQRCNWNQYLHHYRHRYRALKQMTHRWHWKCNYGLDKIRQLKVIWTKSKIISRMTGFVK